MARANRVRRVGDEIGVEIPDRHASPFRDNSPRHVAAKAGSSPSDNSSTAGESALENLHYWLFIISRGVPHSASARIGTVELALRVEPHAEARSVESGRFHAAVDRHRLVE